MSISFPDKTHVYLPSLPLAGVRVHAMWWRVPVCSDVWPCTTPKGLHMRTFMRCKLYKRIPSTIVELLQCRPTAHPSASTGCRRSRLCMGVRLFRSLGVLDDGISLLAFNLPDFDGPYRDCLSQADSGAEPGMMKTRTFTFRREG